MQGQTTSALQSTITAFAAATAVLIFLPPNSLASAAGTCLAAPKGAPAEGRHWYYRTDRALQRKCWYLASEDRDETQPAARTGARSKPTAKRVAAEADTTTPAQQDTRPLVTRQASDVNEESGVAPDDALVIPPADPRPALVAEAPAPQPAAMSAPTEAAPAPAPSSVAASAQAPADVSNLGPPIEAQAAPSRAADATESAPTSMLQYVFLMLAFAGLIGGAVLYMVEMRRRRSDVLNVATRPNPAAHSGRSIKDATRASRPASPRPIARDEVDEALERLAQLRKQQVA